MSDSVVDPTQLFQIDCVLAKHAGGTLYRAHNRESGEIVALKVVRNAEAHNDVSAGVCVSASLSLCACWPFFTHAVVASPQFLFELKLLTTTRECPYIVRLINAYMRVRQCRCFGSGARCRRKSVVD
jgi:serine/threonine protein kinase